MDVKLKRPKRFSLPATLGAFAVGIVGALGILWVADRPSPDPGPAPPSSAAAASSTGMTPATAGDTSSVATGGSVGSTTSAAAPASPVTRLLEFGASLSGGDAVLTWALSAPLNSGTVYAMTEDLEIFVREEGGRWTAGIRGSSVDPQVGLPPPDATGSAVALRIPATVLGDLPVNLTSGIRPQGDPEITPGNSVRLG